MAEGVQVYHGIMGWVGYLIREKYDRAELVALANDETQDPMARLAAVSLVRNIDKRVQAEVDAEPDHEIGDTQNADGP